MHTSYITFMLCVSIQRYTYFAGRPQWQRAVRQQLCWLFVWVCHAELGVEADRLPPNRFIGNAVSVPCNDTRNKDRRWIFDKQDMLLMRVPVPTLNRSPPAVQAHARRQELYVYVELNTQFALNNEDAEAHWCASALLFQPKYRLAHPKN